EGGQGYLARRELVRGRPHWCAYQREGGGEKRVEIGATHQITPRQLNDVLMLLEFTAASSLPTRFVAIRLEAESREALTEALRMLSQVDADPPEPAPGGGWQ